MVGISIASPTASPQRKNIVYYAGSAADAKANFYKITDGTEDTVTEEMTCSIKTKHYDFGYSPRYKRLNWWGLDCNTTDPVNTKIYVLIADYRLTWANARQYRWADLETWWQPIQYPWTTDTAVANRSTYSKPFRQFIKFLKSVRYRLIRFEITMTTNGATNRGPIRIYSITAFTNPKEIMEKKVS
jgi:hypothetical protein